MRHIIAYIAEDSPAAAHKLKNKVMEACKALGDNPLLGQERTDLTTLNVRFWPVHRNYSLS